MSMTDSKSNEEKIDDAAEETAAEEELPLSFCHACMTPFEDYYYLGEKYGFTLVGCLNCGSAVADPYPNADFMEKFHEKYKEKLPPPANPERENKRHEKRIRSLMEMTKGKDFLGVGCGYGYSVIAAATLDLEAFGIDTREQPIKTAKKNLSKDHFDQTTLEQYAKSGKQADIVYVEHGLEQSSDPNAFIEAMKKVLKPGGVVYLETPDGNHFMIPSNFARWKVVTPPAVLHYFSRKGVEILLERHGLKVEKFFFNFRPRMRLIAKHAQKSADKK